MPYLAYLEKTGKASNKKDPAEAGSLFSCVQSE